MVHESAEDFLVRESFRQVAPDLPRLYVTQLTVVAFVVGLLYAVAPPRILGGWALVLGIAAVTRGVYWWKIVRRIDSFSVPEMRVKLREIDRIGTVLLVFFASAGLLVMQTSNLQLRTVTMLAIWAATVGTAFYLSVLPDCARAMVVSVTAAVCAVFLWSNDFTLTAATTLLISVSYALLIQLQRSYELFKAGVEARYTIDAMRREALGLAMTDALTGLPNRRAFDARLAVLASDARPFALAAIDLDGFKPVNDVFGHGIGDRTLIMVAERLRGLGPRVFAARFGGDEFILLIEGADFVEPLIQRAVEALGAPYAIDGVSVHVGASCGLAYWRAPGDEVDLLKRADAALYLAKSREDRNLERDKGGRCVVVKSAA